MKNVTILNGDLFSCPAIQSRDSPIDTATRLKTARLRIGNQFSAGSKRFISSTTSIPTLESTQAPMDTRILSRGLKQPGRKAHYTLPPCATVKKCME
jgi:hypothetical protein